AGTAGTYTSTGTTTVTSTAGDAVLTAGDASPTAPGKLVNGTAALASPLQLKAASARGTGGDFVALPPLSSPATVLTYSGRVPRAAVTLTYQQATSATETLRTGTYTKAVTYTLATINP